MRTKIAFPAYAEETQTKKKTKKKKKAKKAKKKKKKPIQKKNASINPNLGFLANPGRPAKQARLHALVLMLETKYN